MSQTTNILKHLKKGKTLTAIQALNLFGCFRLASRINDLKRMGFSITSTMVSKGNKRFAKYSLK
jgi:hypothetical protein